MADLDLDAIRDRAEKFVARVSEDRPVEEWKALAGMAANSSAQDVPALLDRLAELDEDRRQTWAEADKMREERDGTRAALIRCAEQRDKARAEVERLRAEHSETLERIHSGYNVRLRAAAERAVKRDAEVVRYRRAVAQVRTIHRQYRSAFTDEFDVCSGCTIGMELVRWPCLTIKAIEEAVKP